MRALTIAAALSACSAAPAGPPPPLAHRVPPPPPAPSWDRVALTVDRTAPLAITARAVELGGDPTHELRAAFQINYDVVVQGPRPPGAEVTNRIRCRVVGVNLYLPDIAFGYDLTGERTQLARGDASLVAVPEACEIGFAYRRTPRAREHPRDSAHDTPIVATACLDAHGLRDGPCAPGTFPPPVLPAGFSIGLTMAKYRITDAMGGGLLLDGGVTFADAPRSGRPYTLSYRCDDGARGDLDLADLMELEELDVLPAGSTLALRSMVGGDPAPTARSRCDLTLTSRAPLVMHGRYCLAGGDGAPGPCKNP